MFLYDSDLPLWNVLDRSLSKATPNVTATAPTDDSKPKKEDEGPPKIVLIVKKPQTIVWPPFHVPYGSKHEDVPQPQIIEGNTAAEPKFVSPLDAVVPPSGLLALSVTVAGNDVLFDGAQQVVATVDRVPLVVTALPASMPTGTEIPMLKHAITGPIPTDVATVRLEHAVTKQSPANLGGYDITLKVTVISGSADNYDIGLKNRRLIVIALHTDIDETITRLRHSFLSRKDEDLLIKLDDLEHKRDNREANPGVLALELQELDAELYERTDVAVTSVTATAKGIVKIECDQELEIEATVKPATATDKTIRWTCGEPKLVERLPNGKWKRIGADGGTTNVMAWSNPRDDAPPAFVAVEVRLVKLCQSIELSGTVQPPEADHGLTWRIEGEDKKQYQIRWHKSYRFYTRTNRFTKRDFGNPRYVGGGPKTF